MRYSLLLSSLWLLSTLALSAALPPTDSSALDKRTPEPGPEAAPAPAPVAEEEAHALEERGGGGKDSVNVKVSVKVKVKSGKPAYDWQPDFSGFGYGIDYRGQGPPSWCPSGWQWFGREIGWAPYKGWTPQPQWQPPVVFIKIWIRVSWWSPPRNWCNYWQARYRPNWYRYDIPSHWGWHPRPYRGKGGWYRHQNGYRYRGGKDWGGGWGGWRIKRDEETVEA